MDQPIAQPELLLRVDETARRLSLARSTVYQLVASGALPSVRFGRSVRIPLADLEAWVATRTESGFGPVDRGTP